MMHGARVRWGRVCVMMMAVVRRASGRMLIGRRMLALGGRQFAGAARAQRRVRAVRVEGALHGHGASLRVAPHSIRGQLSGVDACRVCLKQAAA